MRAMVAKNGSSSRDAYFFTTPASSLAVLAKKPATIKNSGMWNE